jgi:hypothetical protein
MNTNFWIPLALALPLLGCTLLAAPLAITEAGRKLDHRTSWVANSFGKGGEAWVQNWMNDIAVFPDGTVYTNTEWDEAGRDAGVYRDGKCLANPGFTHGWGHGGGRAVAVNNEYLFIAQSRNSEGGHLNAISDEGWPPADKQWWGISRRLRTQPDQGAAFEGGRADTGHQPKKAFRIVNETGLREKAPIAGLAVSLSGRLYASNPFKGTIDVFDAGTMKPLASWPCLAAGKLATDARNRLWVILKATGQPARIVCFNEDGVRGPQEIMDVEDPGDLAFDNHGSLMVGENGRDLQIRFYTDLDTRPRLLKTFGLRGGVLAGRAGEIRDDKLTGAEGVGCDALGNLYVASNCFGDGTDLRSFTPEGKLRWRLVCHTLTECAAAAGEKLEDVYLGQQRYAMDWSRKEPGTEWTWKAFTRDPHRFPDDPRNVWNPCNVWPRIISGQRFLFMSDMYASRLAVFRLTDQDDIAVPCGYLTALAHKEWPKGVRPKADGEFFWIDGNGDGAVQAEEMSQDKEPKPLHDLWGWSVDAQGGIWQAYGDRWVRHFPLVGINSNGIPKWSFENYRTFPVPSPFNHLQRAEYLPETDTLILGGYTIARPRGQDWGQTGSTLARYDGWLKSGGRAKPTWILDLPYEQGKIMARAISVAGDYVFVGYQATCEIRVYHLRSGAYMGYLKAGPEVNSVNGWIDIAYGISAHRKPDGEYVVFCEEVMWGKVMVFRWTPDHEPPEISLSEPATDSTIAPGSILTLKTDIAKATAPVRKVVFFSGSEPIGEVDAPPYVFAWRNVPVGQHVIKAVAYDTQGAETPSPMRTITCGPVGRLKVEWDAVLGGFWQISGPTNGTDRLREPREVSLGTEGEWLLGLAGGGDVKLQMTKGVSSLQNPQNAGVAIIPPNRLIFTVVEIVVDPGKFGSWSQVAACEAERMTTLRDLHVVPGPDYLLQLGEGKELRFGVGTDGTIVLPKDETRFEARANTLKWVGGPTRP